MAIAFLAAICTRTNVTHAQSVASSPPPGAATNEPVVGIGSVMDLERGMAPLTITTTGPTYHVELDPGADASWVHGSRCVTPCTLYVTPGRVGIRATSSTRRRIHVIAQVPPRGLALRLRARSRPRMYWAAAFLTSAPMLTIGGVGLAGAGLLISHSLCGGGAVTTCADPTPSTVAMIMGSVIALFSLGTAIAGTVLLMDRGTERSENLTATARPRWMITGGVSGMGAMAALNLTFE